MINNSMISMFSIVGCRKKNDIMLALMLLAVTIPCAKNNEGCAESVKTWIGPSRARLVLVSQKCQYRQKHYVPSAAGDNKQSVSAVLTVKVVESAVSLLPLKPGCSCSVCS